MSNFKVCVAVGKKQIKVDKQIMVEMMWDNRTYSVIFLVVDKLFAKVILGLDWLKENHISIHCGRNVVVSSKEKEGMERVNGKMVDAEVKMMIITGSVDTCDTYKKKWFNEQKIDPVWGKVIKNIEKETSNRAVDFWSRIDSSDNKEENVEMVGSMNIVGIKNSAMEMEYEKSRRCISNRHTINRDVFWESIIDHRKKKCSQLSGGYEMSRKEKGLGMLGETVWCNNKEKWKEKCYT